jgi:polysaccharide biosynthesis transport protein
LWVHFNIYLVVYRFASHHLNSNLMQPKEYTEEIDFQKYWLVLKRRWLPATGVFAAVVAFAAWYSLRQEPIYQAQGRLLFKSDRTSSLVGLQQGDSGQLIPIDSQNSPLDTEAEIAQSLPIAEEAVEQLDLKDEFGEPINARIIASGLSVSSVTGTDILEISYQDFDPERAAAIVNTVMDVYIKNNIQTNRAEAVAAREFINDQLPEVEAAVRLAEAELSAFKERNRVIVLQEEASRAVESISSLDDTITQAQAQLADVSARSDELRRQVGMSSEQAINVGALSQSPGVQEALVQLQTVQAELAVERTRYQPTHPTIANLEQRAAALDRLLDQRVGEVLEQQQSVSVGDLQTGQIEQALISQFVQTEVERLGLIRRIDLLSTAQSTFEERASVLPELEKTQRELERKLAAAQTTYETLLTRLQEVQVTENQNVGNARIIEAAIVPSSSVAPNSSLQIAAGGFVGLLLAIATAFLLDLTDQSVKTIKEGKELLGYTLLGVIPTFDKTGKPGKKDAEHSIPRIIARDMPNSSVREAYQMLQANLKFLRSDRELKTIVVTSSVAGEGKSEVSANLAAAIAQLGRNVLLIDADMRSPSQHHAWDLTNSVGLSNVIVGQSNFREAIKTGIPHLHILPAGVIPPNPVALLDSERMATLIEHFASKYDFIILDTPPIAGCADALILGRMTDGILLVMRPGIVESASATAAKNLLTQSGQQVLGIVANGIDVRNEPDSYFYYTQDYLKGQHSNTQNSSIPEEAELTP